MHFKLFIIHWKELILCSIRFGIFALVQLVFYILTSSSATTTTAATATTTTTALVTPEKDLLVVFPLMTNLVVVSYCWLAIGGSCVMWILITKAWCCCFSHNNTFHLWDDLKFFSKVYMASVPFC